MPSNCNQLFKQNLNTNLSLAKFTIFLQFVNYFKKCLLFFNFYNNFL